MKLGEVISRKKSTAFLNELERESKKTVSTKLYKYLNNWDNTRTMDWFINGFTYRIRV